jgi:AbrB family looped-hinge helix DNA binding protein
MTEATISSKNQIVVPKEVRTALGVKAGDKLLVHVRGNTVILMPKPKDHLKALYGIAKGLYPEGYLRKERKSWD